MPRPSVLRLKKSEDLRTKLKLCAPERGAKTPFHIYVDEVELKRPIRFNKLPHTAQAIKQPMLFVGNFTPVVRKAYRIGLDGDGDGPVAWRVALDTDAAPFGGSGFLATGVVSALEPIAAHGYAHSIAIDLPPLCTLFLVPA